MDQHFFSNQQMLSIFQGLFLQNTPDRLLLFFFASVNFFETYATGLLFLTVCLSTAPTPLIYAFVYLSFGKTGWSKIIAICRTNLWL